MTLYCVYLRKILALGVKADQEIQHSTVALCAAVSALAIDICSKTKVRLEKWFRTSPTRRKLHKRLHIGLIQIVYYIRPGIYMHALHVVRAVLGLSSYQTLALFVNFDR